MKTAIVLFSGGQDSTTCLYWALHNFDSVRAIGFDYGQRHKIELAQAKLIADMVKVPFQVVNVEGLSNSALLNNSDVSGQHPNNPDLPASFVPARNALFLTIAAGVAFSHDIGDIVTGVCQTDFSGYPDCRRRFIDAMEVSLGLALDRDFRIHTPLMYLTKAETFKLAKELNCLDVVIEMTHTDYNGDRSTRNEWGYGKLDNPASVLRAKGFAEAKAKGWI